MSEEWRDVIGYEGLYEVSSFGRVRSEGRWRAHFRGGTAWHAGRVLRSQTTRGYGTVSLQRSGSKPRSALVHRLVAEAFIGPCPTGQVVRHRDGDSRNNRADNLVYGTPKENVHDQIAHGTHYNYRKLRCSRNHLLAGPNLMWATGASGPQRRCACCFYGRRAANDQGHRGDEVWIAAWTAKRYQRSMGEWEANGGETEAMKEWDRAQNARRAEEALRTRFNHLLPSTPGGLATKIEWAALAAIVVEAEAQAVAHSETHQQSA